MDLESGRLLLIIRPHAAFQALTAAWPLTARSGRFLLYTENTNLPSAASRPSDPIHGRALLQFLRRQL